MGYMEATIKEKQKPDVSIQQRREDKLRRDAQEARRVLRGVQQRTRHSHVFITPQALAAAAEIKQAELDAAWAEHLTWSYQQQQPQSAPLRQGDAGHPLLLLRRSCGGGTAGNVERIEGGRRPCGLRRRGGGRRPYTIGGYGNDQSIVLRAADCSLADLIRAIVSLAS